ncbi:histidine phosphatase family protein [Phycicoccus endophyticus]|uniref:Histidine phosphatase family protein n=1 Tax=Phycicoccus endophyticus TaxID=1690220 RepID=A0A7G9R3N1_9MICO|nr:histidine phosphatase family protein [Phycicoccus endophyticus]NHI18024.1 histidine phosphatase family protein [Phycicoccus endophyticus]QNN50206.1 histidine phosphatase family protein [Phycicoccus endophyticus]
MPADRVHLVRHGESTWNLQRRLQGQTAHPPLTGRGREQAARAAATLRRLVAGPVRLLSSDLIRARQTADILAGTLGVEVHERAELREQALGALEGRLTRELRAQPVPAGLDVTEVRWGGGESIADVHARVGLLLAEVALWPVPDIVLVTHGDTLRVALAVLEGRGHREVAWEVVGNGEVVTRSLGNPFGTPAPGR